MQNRKEGDRKAAFQKRKEGLLLLKKVDPGLILDKKEDHNHGSKAGKRNDVDHEKIALLLAPDVEEIVRLLGLESHEENFSSTDHAIRWLLEQNNSEHKINKIPPDKFKELKAQAKAKIPEIRNRINEMPFPRVVSFPELNDFEDYSEKEQKEAMKKAKKYLSKEEHEQLRIESHHIHAKHKEELGEPDVDSIYKHLVYLEAHRKLSIMAKVHGKVAFDIANDAALVGRRKKTEAFAKLGNAESILRSRSSHSR